MTDLTPASRVRLRQDRVRWREVGGSIVVMDLDGSNFFSVEGSIADVWSSLADGAVIAELASHLEADYDVPAAVIAADLVQLASQLLARSVLEVWG